MQIKDKKRNKASWQRRSTLEGVWTRKGPQIKAKVKEIKSKLSKIAESWEKIWCFSSKRTKEDSNAKIAGRKKRWRLFHISVSVILI